MYSKSCDAHGHRYFVADCAAVEAEGKVVVIALCTSCGEFISHEVIVALSKAKFTLLKQNNKEEAIT